MVRVRKDKEAFIKEMQHRIEMRGTIINFVENVYFPLMATKFDGKVYNVRFLNALNEETKKVSDLLYVRNAYSSKDIEVNMRINQWNYNDYESIRLKCNTNSDGRIDYAATIGDETCAHWIESFKKYCDEYQSAIDNYDEYMAVAERLSCVVDDYNKLPYSFRGNIDNSFIHIY